MTKLFVSENDHEKAALSLAFLKITTILFRFRPKNKKTTGEFILRWTFCMINLLIEDH